MKIALAPKPLFLLSAIFSQTTCKVLSIKSVLAVCNAKPIYPV